MNRVWIAALALTSLLLPFASAARADDGLHIAVANPAKIFNEMQETKDLKQKMESDTKLLADQEAAKSQEVESIKAALKVLTPGSQQYRDKSKEFVQKQVDLEAWRKVNQVQVQEDQKAQMKTLFDKITDATQAVAKANNIDLVVAETNVDFPDLSQINVDQLRTLINQRNVMFSSGKLDISDKITAKLDADYKAKK